jgi:hypothetical protein
VSAQAQVLAFSGRLQAARQLFQQVINLTEQQGLSEVAAGSEAQLAWTEAVYGHHEHAAEESKRVTTGTGPASLIDGPLPRFRAVAAMAIIGETRAAQLVVNEAVARYPESTLVRTVLVPVTNALIAIGAGRPDEALEALRPAALYEFGSLAGGVPSYVRGQAYLAKGAGAEALAEFDRLLGRRGVDPFSPIFALGHLGRARALAVTGDRAESAEAYRAFLEVWREADSDLPILHEARVELEKLAGTR